MSDEWWLESLPANSCRIPRRIWSSCGSFLQALVVIRVTPCCAALAGWHLLASPKGDDFWLQAVKVTLLNPGQIQQHTNFQIWFILRARSGCLLLLYASTLCIASLRPCILASCLDKTYTKHCTQHSNSASTLTRLNEAHSHLHTPTLTSINRLPN